MLTLLITVVISAYVQIYPRGHVGDLWRIRQVDFSRGLRQIYSRVHQSPPQTLNSAANPLRIRPKYAAEPQVCRGFTKIVRHESAAEKSAGNFLRVLGSAGSPPWQVRNGFF